MTSAPNQARSCVQVGPDCTCVKSRTRTPSRAFISSSLFLFQHALRIEVANTAAFAACRRVDDCVDERRLARIQSRIYRTLQLIGRCCVDSNAAEGLHHFVVAGVFYENSDSRIGTAGRIDLNPAINAVVVEDDDADGEIVPA